MCFSPKAVSMCLSVCVRSWFHCCSLRRVGQQTYGCMHWVYWFFDLHIFFLFVSVSVLFLSGELVGFWFILRQHWGCIHELPLCPRGYLCLIYETWILQVTFVNFYDLDISELCIVNLLNVAYKVNLMQISFSLNNKILQFPCFSCACNWLVFVQLTSMHRPSSRLVHTEFALQIIAVEKCCQGAHSPPNFLPLIAQNATTSTASGERTAPVKLDLSCLTWWLMFNHKSR